MTAIKHNPQEDASRAQARPCVLCLRFQGRRKPRLRAARAGPQPEMRAKPPGWSRGVPVQSCGFPPLRPQGGYTIVKAVDLQVGGDSLRRKGLCLDHNRWTARAELPPSRTVCLGLSLLTGPWHWVLAKVPFRDSVPHPSSFPTPSRSQGMKKCLALAHVLKPGLDCNEQLRIPQGRG